MLQPADILEYLGFVLAFWAGADWVRLSEGGSNRPTLIPVIGVGVVRRVL